MRVGVGYPLPGRKRARARAIEDDRYWAVGFRMRSGKLIKLKDAATCIDELPKADQ
jgi:hypothetical protein